MTKPSELARCLVNICDISDLGGKESNILTQDEKISEKWIAIGSGLTPIDCYIELFLMQMLLNEKSKCTITTASGQQISCVLKLLRIENSDLFFTKSPGEMLALAKNYKDNGVKMFPKYPLYAHRYFNRAAKCLLCCAPLEDLDPAQEGVDTISEMQTLLEVLYLNISACLLKQNRYEEVLHILEYVDRQEKPSEKAVYRKALAQFHVKQFPEAIKTLEKIDYISSKDCVVLHQQIKSSWQQEDNKYNCMVKKMFG
ncbi:protein Bride of doubletime [Ochlerotatus camptorhynchus]|uniref:protein Bride of doubletime n=1 Tax=Ochlerotatus camptorhynchus TaxID=644619 RepID=UPI0031D821D8